VSTKVGGRRSHDRSEDVAHEQSEDAAHSTATELFSAFLELKNDGQRVLSFGRDDDVRRAEHGSPQRRISGRSSRAWSSVGRWPLLSCDLQEIQEYTRFQILFQNYQNNVFKLYKLKFLSGTN
jgi:hypothetical protein